MRFKKALITPLNGLADYVMRHQQLLPQLMEDLIRSTC